MFVKMNMIEQIKGSVGWPYRGVSSAESGLDDAR